MGGFGVPMGVSEGSIGVLRPPPWGSGATMGVLGSSHWDFEVSIGVWGHCWGSGGLHCGFGVSIGFFGAHFWGSGATVGAFGVSIGVWGHYWAFGVSSLWFWEVSIGTLGPTIAVLGSFHWGIWHLHWFFGLPVGISPLPSPPLPPSPPNLGVFSLWGPRVGFGGTPLGFGVPRCRPPHPCRQQRWMWAPRSRRTRRWIGASLRCARRTRLWCGATRYALIAP